MRNVVCLLMGFLVLQGCSREYVQETIRVYNDGGVTFDMRVRPKEGFIYQVGPFIDFIAENKSGQDVYLMETRRQFIDNEVVYKKCDIFTNGILRDVSIPYPVNMPNNSRIISYGSLPDPSPFEPGKIPVTVQVKFQIGGVDREISSNFEITVK